MSEKEKKSAKIGRKSQVTIFIIIGLIIIVFIALLFVLIRPPETNISTPADVNGYVKKCIKDSIENSSKELIASNFYPNMSSNYIIYGGTKLKYLCKSGQFYLPCVNQEPMLNEYLRRFMIDRANSDLKQCFTRLKQSLQDQSYEIKEGDLKIEIEMYNEKIVGIVEKNITLTKREETRSFKKFSNSINSPLYKLAYHTRNILNFESALCEFNAIGWVEEYSDIKINRFVTSDQSKIYILTDRPTGMSVGFAVKT